MQSEVLGLLKFFIIFFRSIIKKCDYKEMRRFHLNFLYFYLFVNLTMFVFLLDFLKNIEKCYINKRKKAKFKFNGL